MVTILTMKRGDTKKISVSAVDGEGTPLDLTAAENIFFTIKRKASDADDDAIVAKELGDGIVVDDAEGGLATITIDPEDTEDVTGYARGLKWDIQLVMVSGAVYTIASGLIAIESDVTQRIA